ncbi:MAG: hypothetical protein IMZ55_12065 [Acidobacteria bacterium]|nr:hypothetical protein [Acidobacteriota bacterium]
MPQYQDDLSIADDAELWRRIPPNWWVWNDNLHQMRPTSQAFGNHPNGTPMSVVLAHLLEQRGAGPSDVLAGHAGFALASLTAGLARQCNQLVARDPLPDEPAHALVAGKKTGSVRRRFATECRWVVPPPCATP